MPPSTGRTTDKYIWPDYDLDLCSLTLKTFWQRPLTCCIFVTGFTEIPPPSTEISRHKRKNSANGRTDDGQLENVMLSVPTVVGEEIQETHQEMR